MCIAIHKPALVRLAPDVLERCFKHNPDGAGFAALTTDGLRIKKGFFTFDSFMEAFKPFELRPALIHFRISTAGKVDKFNCHPWEVRVHGYRFAIIHNGMLPHRSSADMSDTGHFVQDIIRPMLERDPNAPFRNEIRARLASIINRANKLVIMRDDGKVSIINEEAGTRDLHDCWFSNCSYRPRIVKAKVERITFPDEPCSGPVVRKPYRVPPAISWDELDRRLAQAGDKYIDRVSGEPNF